ncbi:hypothetical protein E2C01_071209 [Portunus trituberculatus]|uniref:Uncharacterized protein n=1 Tax=Portunus trituberculatus TaxID=210409 RepID=A0A5B7I5M1_PORTR|nr:hypothetical protein [Portunus trituberculatus]
MIKMELNLRDEERRLI